MSDALITQQLNSFINLAQDMGFEIRHEILNGVGAGVCEIKGKRCLFLDLSCRPADQLEAIRETLGQPMMPPQSP